MGIISICNYLEKNIVIEFYYEIYPYRYFLDMIVRSVPGIVIHTLRVTLLSDSGHPYLAGCWRHRYA